MRSLAQKELSGRFFVGVTTTSALDTVEAGAPSLSVFNRFDEAEPAYQGPFDRTSLLEFVDKVSEPLIRQLDLPNLVNLMQSGIPLAMIFSANKDERRAISKDLAGLALKYRNLVNFVTVDAEKHSFLLGHFGLHMHSLPAFVIQTPDDVFPLNPVSEIRFDTVDGFIRQVVPGL
ncbi:protein disulfide-isomerase, putative [Paecilomyces variotii No. 5]|uniref:Protein disulfide-isomerase, putative n=1 Tax=Byssochlamys spectabilis (strain No. 5 / NBRC 109023) TaxID=1356009 RepID=V5HWC0_BYSSN|nr:protein disulfide-isomerase, putative [Paecilomyces variotii No. 5]